jgi:hypothetical protein
VLTQHSYTSTADGGFTYTPVYCCLSQFDTRNAPRFKKGAPPPTALPEAMSQFNLGTPLGMTDVTVDRGNGLTYFNPQYVGALRDVFEETEQEVLKTFSKSVTVSTPRGNNPANAIERTFTITFDYMSMTVTTSSKFNYIVRRGANSLVSQPFNISGDFGRVSFRPDRILTRNRTKAASGQTTYSASVTGIYV